ncbi:MAG: MspI family type II restriction endonuclease [Desulfotomaculum sp.]|nr:MspI family type II restriction endonuclease [Desulfotomaculum sp.]
MSDNTSKLIHGIFGKMSLRDLMQLLKKQGYISKYQETFRAGYRDINPKQFYFQFLIMFDDNERWIVHSTTSIRTDRINIQQWNAYHIKKVEDIKKSIIVYPDHISDSERDNARSYHNKILNNQIYSSIDCVVSQSEFYRMVEEKYFHGKVVGQQKALQGLDFEEKIEKILNNRKNFAKWTNVDELETGLFYPCFQKIMNVIGINDPSTVKGLNATRDVKLLSSGGKPKTDVLLMVTFYDGSTKNYTFSCKRTSSNWVTVHEYPVDKFIDVLQIDDPFLKKALKEFQRVGGKRKLGSEFTRYLERELPKYNKKLAKWVYGGIGGDGNPDTQWAYYMIVYQNETLEFRIYKLEEYIEDILKVKGGHFGTPFKWTYPSGGKGKRIQLKGVVL